MANRRRLRPADPSLPEYLENPFPEVRTENHSQPVPFRLPQPPSGFSAPARPALAKSISGLVALLSSEVFVSYKIIMHKNNHI